MVQTEDHRKNSGPSILLERRVEIFHQSPLPELDGPAGPAFAARLKEEESANLMAIVCTKSILPRLDFVNAMRSIDNPGILRFREAGVVEWPGNNSSRFVIACDRPASPRFWLSLDETRPQMSEDAVNRFLVAPLTNALSELHRIGVVHGGIRPDNIFWREGSASPPQLAECLSVQPGVGQPVLFETVERGMALPLGRGAGEHIDDCYALGVTLACIIMGRNPLRGLNDKEIINLKLEFGSFNAIAGTHHLAASHAELLRGLLADDPKQRWTVSDLELWLAGRRLTPKSSDSGKRANRHITFAGNDYWRLRPLAAAMAENVPEAVKLIQSKAIGKWLMHSFGEDDKAGDVEDAIAATDKSGGKAAHYEDTLVARVCMAIDPIAPIRYRGISAMPGGLAALLAEAVYTGENLQTMGEIINSQLVSFWVDVQEKKADFIPLAQQFERAGAVIEKTTFGNGLERAVYTLNPFLMCLSPMIRDHCVLSPRKLLLALEQISGRQDRPVEPMDRHIAAFLIVRDKRSELLFASMAPSEPPARRGVAMLTLYSELQYRYGPESLPGLAAWLYPLVEPAVARFLSKPLREKIRRQTKEAVNKGDLTKLLALVDDPKSIERDENDFLSARVMYSNIKAEIEEIETELSQRQNIGIALGRSIAAVISSLLSIAVLAVILGRILLKAMG